MHPPKQEQPEFCFVSSPRGCATNKSDVPRLVHCRTGWHDERQSSSSACRKISTIAEALVATEVAKGLSGTDLSDVTSPDPFATRGAMSAALELRTVD
jgi:hypothetical protein